MKPKNLQASPGNPHKKNIIRLVVLAAIAAAGYYVAKLEFFHVVDVNNGNFYITRYPIVRENWDHPRLKLLRESEKLDQVIAPGKTEFEKIVLLRKWAHDQWQGSSTTFYYPPWDALEILDLARNHGNKAFCAQYAIVFLQACLSLGIPARYVDLPGHFAVEVWVNQYNRWAYMDPTSDIHFERDGIPVKGTLLSEGYWKDKYKDIVKVGPGGARTPATKEDLKILRMFSIVLRKNHLTRPIMISVNKGPYRPLTLQSDYRKYPLVGRDSVGFGEDFIAWDQEGETEFFYDKNRSHHADDFVSSFNQTMIYVGSDELNDNDSIRLSLKHENSPTFETFLCRSDRGSKFVPADEVMLWPLHQGFNTFYAKVRTRHGWEGPEASIKVFFKRSWIKK